MWSECSETCGGGSRTSNRTIKQPALHGGNDCIGDDTQIEACNLESCPGTTTVDIPINTIFKIH